MDKAEAFAFLDRIYDVMLKRLDLVVAKATLQRYKSTYAYIALSQCSRTHMFLMMYTIGKLLEASDKVVGCFGAAIRAHFVEWYYARHVPSLSIATASRNVSVLQAARNELWVVPLLPDSLPAWNYFWQEYLARAFEAEPLADSVVVVAYNAVVYEITVRKLCGCVLWSKNNRLGLLKSDDAYDVTISTDFPTLEKNASFMGMCPECVNLGLNELASAFVLSDSASVQACKH